MEGISCRINDILRSIKYWTDIDTFLFCCNKYNCCSTTILPMSLGWLKSSSGSLIQLIHFGCPLHHRSNCGALRFFCWLSLNCFCVIMLLCVVSRLPIMNLMCGLYFNWSCMVILLCIMTQPSFLNLTSGLCAAWLLLSRCV